MRFIADAADADSDHDSGCGGNAQMLLLLLQQVLALRLFLPLPFCNISFHAVCKFMTTEVTFETGLQGFVQDNNDHFNWRRNNGRTLAYRTGPTFDHTFGTFAGGASHVTIVAWGATINTEGAVSAAYVLEMWLLIITLFLLLHTLVIRLLFLLLLLLRRLLLRLFLL